MPITEIALSVGFSGASYYAETFRKWFGQSPTAFRTDYRKPKKATELQEKAPLPYTS